MYEGKPVYGPFMKSGDAAFVETTGYAGFEFAILDMEHGPVSLETMQNNVRAAQIAGMLPIIRVRDHLPESVSQALDIGAGGVQIPQITSAEEAKAAVHAAKYYPEGERGVCRFVRAANYSSMERNIYFKGANETILILQLEGKEAIGNLDEILDVSGYDILFVGPYDLSQSLGVPGDVTNPLVIQQIQNIVIKARERNIIVGTFLDKLDDLDLWKKLGLQYFCYSVDIGIYYEACRDLRLLLDC
ncbi:MAG: aldolase/citrate lyase family protein [Parabacteroides gordonii]|nr:aldolase/citrate lyase family protein [Parabacteroides gordonii]